MAHRKHFAMLATALVLSACSFHSTAVTWHDRVDIDGEPVFVLSSSYYSCNTLGLVPVFGRFHIGDLIEESMRRIASEGGDRVRLVTADWNNYWYIVPPLSWFVSPVCAVVTFEYRPSAEAFAAVKRAENARAPRAATGTLAAPGPQR
jgi:hypothetical protein